MQGLYLQKILKQEQIWEKYRNIISSKMLTKKYPVSGDAGFCWAEKFKNTRRYDTREKKGEVGAWWGRRELVGRKRQGVEIPQVQVQSRSSYKKVESPEKVDIIEPLVLNFK